MEIKCYGVDNEFSGCDILFRTKKKKGKKKHNKTKHNTSKSLDPAVQPCYWFEKKKKHTTHFYLPLHPYSLTEVLSLSSLFFRAMSVSIDLENQLHSSGTEKIPQALKKN